MLHLKLRYILFVLCLGLLLPLIDQQINAPAPFRNLSAGTVEASVIKIALDGNSLTPAEVFEIAKQKTQVVIAEEALARVQKSQEILLMAARDGHKIYGLTVGVGENKDQDIVDPSGGFTPELIEASKRFNRALLHAHCAGVGPEMEPEVVRAIMVTRLNSVLFGSTGAQPKVAELYRDFLNNDILPVIPSRGSVGEADITLITHIGLAMIGEGEVDYKSKRMPAQEALAAVGLGPLDPFARDALTIISSNAYSEALAALAIVELKHLLRISKVVFALSIQGFNGNIEPFLADSNHVRPFPVVNQVSADIRDLLADSYIWDQSETRSLQDPLSYRTAAYTFGVVEKSLLELERLLKIQLNSSDDNPAVVLDVLAPSSNYEEASHYVVTGDVSGAVLPTANFSPLVWVMTFEELAIALSHASNASAQRTIKLSDDHFTLLSRFLGTKNTVHAYGAIQKVFVSLAAENQELAIPISIAYFAIAGNIEDTATNAPRVMRRVRTMIDNLYFILGIELMHAAQAVDLRLQQTPDLALSPVTEKFRTEYRQVVPFLDEDRVLTIDIEASYQFLKRWEDDTK